MSVHPVTSGVRGVLPTLALHLTKPEQTADSLLKLQRIRGNVFVQRMIRANWSLQAHIQRAPSAGAAVDPVKQQWETDWNSSALRRARRYFRGAGRPVGTSKQRYDVLCPLYRTHGILRPLKYVADNIRTATFYNFKTPAHKNLKNALTVAERILKSKGRAAAPVTKAWAFNARTTSTGKWSNHATGKAIDFDPDINPHLTNPRDRRIISVLTRIDIEKANPGAGSGLDSFDAAKVASDRFKSDYNPAGIRSRLKGLKGQRLALQNDMTVLKALLGGLPSGRKASRDERRRASELKKQIRKKRAEIRQVVKDRRLLKKELQNYEKLDKSIDTLGGKVVALQQEIELLEAMLESASGKERRRLKKQLARKRRALKKTEKRLAKKEQNRQAQRLRRYATIGFLNLPKDLVEAMKAAGFRWGGDWKKHKDFMHFDLP